MRRGIPSNRRWVAGPRRWTPADAGASLLSWMRGDDPGAAINTTPEPHQYAAIPDRGTLGGQYAQATSANQPQVSTLWTPGPAPLFAGGDRLVHSSSASGWGILHIGSSAVRGGLVFRFNGAPATCHYFATFNGGGANTGFLLHAGSDGRARLTVGNGSGGLAAELLSTTGVLTGDTTHIITWERDETDLSLRVDGSEVATGAISSPSASSPQHTLVVGASNTGSVPLSGWVPEVVMFSGSTLPDFSLLESYLSRWSYAP